VGATGSEGGAVDGWAGSSSAAWEDHEGIALSGVGVGSLISDEGGHAGMLSVGGSGGHTSVSAGGAVVFSSAGGHVCCVASDATAWSGLVIGGGSLGAASVPGWVGTVRAHVGEVFCIGTAVLGFDSSTGGVWVFDQTGSPLVIGRAGIASASSAVS
jgi:hypothetical protein